MLGGTGLRRLRLPFFAVAVVAATTVPGLQVRGSDVAIDIRVDQPKAELSPVLYGLFFEDINYSADGGLYAELIQNRSFDYFPVEGSGENQSACSTRRAPGTRSTHKLCQWPGPESRQPGTMTTARAPACVSGRATGGMPLLLCMMGRILAPPASNPNE